MPAMRCPGRPWLGRQLFVVVFLAALGVIIPLSETANEWVEHNLVKKGFFHNFMHRTEWNTAVPKLPDLLLFVHVPRTSGETVKIAMFNNVSFRRVLEWMDGDRFNPMTHGPPVRYWWHSRRDREVLENGTVIQGFFSRDDIVRLKQQTNRSVRMFTILRHPYERSLSYLAMVNAYWPRLPWGQDKGNLTVANAYAEPPVVRTWGYKSSTTWQEAHRNFLVSYLRNGMTWQLGSMMNSKYRALNDTEALERAKSFLREMQVVCFFEDMRTDFFKLRSAMFSHVRVPRIHGLLYWLGTLFGYPRMHILKYFALLTPGEQHLVQEANKLDMELYEWALKEHGRSVHMYNDYADFMWATWHLQLLAAALLLSLMWVLVALLLWVCNLSRLYGEKSCWHRLLVLLLWVVTPTLLFQVIANT